MNSLLPDIECASGIDAELLDLVSFKWLMAGIGWQVNLTRLRRDPDYARAWAQRGMNSGQALLGARSAKLLAALPRHTTGGLG